MNAEDIIKENFLLKEELEKIKKELLETKERKTNVSNKKCSRRYSILRNL